MRAIACGAVLVLALFAGTAAADPMDDCFEATRETTGDKAIALCGRLIDSGRIKGQDLATALNNRGLGYLKKQDYDRAMDDLDRALKINPSYVYALDNRGDVYRMRGLYEPAIIQYNEVIRIDPTFLSAYLSRGQTYLLLGDRRGARADFQAVLSMKGKNRAIDQWAKKEAQRRLDELGPGN